MINCTGRPPAALCLSLAPAGASMAQITDHPARPIIIMSDRSPAYSGIAGIGAVVATQLAIDRFGGKACAPAARGRRLPVIQAAP